ncbi:mitochondrial proton/calcium exchanger protein-like isoform X2 [Sitophilus oryzae]|uniref:Mitochondrial proton/calcium exchanger protein n=1 Tax=Sitophilus oryzae TaxID=7048 RepID=A0A6J2Y196_SITOR|nr:mitochondrial proton/calcium exchanger protein-like isoform X2 [Sitophilus oryzae]
MYVVLRSPHIRNTRSKLMKCCRNISIGNPAVCSLNCHFANIGFIEPRRLYSLTTNPSLLNFNNRKSHTDNYELIRYISLSAAHLEKEPLKPSSKVEVTVQELKKQKEEITKVQQDTQVAKAPVKKSLKQKVVDEIVHYYHGFRLLFIDVKISAGLVWRILQGKTLTRREYRLLTRTVGDLFRLVPFSVFIIVPFMELLLPVFIKLFPGMLPSTFQTTSEREDKIKQSLKVKLEMAKFLQGTLDDMSVQHKDRYSERAKEFVEWFNKIRTSGEQVSNEDIMKFSKLFEDEITLDSLSRSQLIALCRVLDVHTLGTNNFLRFQLRMKLRQLAADDKMIQKEGVHSLTLGEVQQACRARGMRAYGVSEERLRSQLNQWLDLSLNEKVPPSLLLLSRALLLPETIPTTDKLKATISSLPETIVKQTQAAIGEKEGKIDNKIRAEILKEEEKKIKEERKEHKEEKRKLEEKDKELLVDKAPTISASTTPILEDTALRISTEKLEKKEKLKEKEETIHTKDIQIIEHAIDTVSKEKKLIVEKEEIQELKAEMADYEEDVEDLGKALADTPKPDIQETKAAKRLYKSVNRMIGKMDKVLVELEKKEAQLKKDLEEEASDKKKEELLKIDDIIAAINKIKDVPDQSRLEKIVKVLRKMDDDHDGSLKIDDVLKVIEIIGKENVKLSSKQVDELIELIDKEEILEVEDKIEKALAKNLEAKLIENLKEKTAVQEKQQDVEDSGDKKEELSKNEDSKQKTASLQSPVPPSSPKLDSQQPVIPPPSIEKKPENSSKML